jgi:tyrosyl-tRNA synthetase
MSEKKSLAREIVSQFHGKEAAEAADQHFTRVHQQHEAPEEMPEVSVEGVAEGQGEVRIDLSRPVVAGGFVKSASELKRLVAQNAVEVTATR